MGAYLRDQRRLGIRQASWVGIWGAQTGSVRPTFPCHRYSVELRPSRLSGVCWIPSITRGLFAQSRLCRVSVCPRACRCRLCHNWWTGIAPSQVPLTLWYLAARIEFTRRSGLPILGHALCEYRLQAEDPETGAVTQECWDPVVSRRQIERNGFRRVVVSPRAFQFERIRARRERTLRLVPPRQSLAFDSPGA